jgi:putative hydrolases of HD superfamily
MASINASPEPAERLESLLQLQALGRVPRLGWLLAGLQQAESVAAHSHLAALLALHLAPQCVPALDGPRTAALLAVHDGPEALLGDWPALAKELLPPGAKAQAEGRAALRLFRPLGPAVEALFAEFAAQASPESRLARACDRLALALCRLAYRRAGASGLDQFLPGLRALDLDEFPPAKSLLQEILATEPAGGTPA